RDDALARPAADLRRAGAGLACRASWPIPKRHRHRRRSPEVVRSHVTCSLSLCGRSETGIERSPSAPQQKAWMWTVSPVLYMRPIRHGSPNQRTAYSVTISGDCTGVEPEPQHDAGSAAQRPLMLSAAPTCVIPAIQPIASAATPFQSFIPRPFL